MQKGKGAYIRATFKNGNNLIGVMCTIPGIPLSLLSATLRALHDRGYNALLMNDDADFARQFESVEMFKQKKVSSVIFRPIISDTEYERNLDTLTKLKQSGIPTVQLDCYFEEPNLDYVTSNNFEASYILTKYLIKKGCSRIAYLKASRCSSSEQRIAGYRRAIEEHGIKFNESLVKSITAKVGGIKIPIENIIEGVAKIKQMPDAFIANDDEACLKVTQWLLARGAKIPEDVAITCFDAPRAAISPIRFTAVNQPFEKMADKAVQMAIDRINGKAELKTKKIVLKSRFVIGAST